MFKSVHLLSKATINNSGIKESDRTENLTTTNSRMKTILCQVFLTAVYKCISTRLFNTYLLAHSVIIHEDSSKALETLAWENGDGKDYGLIKVKIKMNI